ncbi:hypothetical protein MtrunA17_Chr5g0427941 [Medicago truncatula]|uniref:Uncharacterized protein n=1 Tax=Medicago truncatula TaxID=3880 RepID=A0A396HSH1_MEDTR|nr:hypothetical protein MtrunA17_Chr5g0427941 [Medicago truncatula]
MMLLSNQRHACYLVPRYCTVPSKYVYGMSVLKTWFIFLIVNGTNISTY